MAQPVQFPQQNMTLGAPPGKEEALSLPVYANDEECISCWRLSWRERLAALIHGTVWLRVMSGPTQPPVAVQGLARDVWAQEG